jgi:hypothetical protein
MADMLDIFNQDAFKVTTMAQGMRDIKYVPGFIGSAGLFRTTSIDTLDMAIEKDADQNIFIVGSSPRGGVGQTFGKNRRTMRKLPVPHFQVDDAIYADEVQSVRAFGETVATERLVDRISRRGGEVSQSFALTEEYHRLKVITTGQMLDKDGSLLFDYFTEFGEVAPTEIAFDLDNAAPARGALRKATGAVVRAMGVALDGIPFNGILAICGDAFWDSLVTHSEVEKTYLNWQAAQELRGNIVSTTQAGIWGAMTLFDIKWVNYRGGQSVGVDTDKVYFIPLGTPDLFRTVYAPADYIETVNTLGQRLYAKVYRMQNDKGMNMEFQSNVIHYCTRPKVILRGRRGS